MISIANAQIFGKNALALPRVFVRDYLLVSGTLGHKTLYELQQSSGM
jgi:hypothetical protein